jgi:very-short-patch-repair endonuclease
MRSDGSGTWLRAHRFANYKFKRQAPIGPYIVDFVCFDRRSILEIDGGQHANSAG